MSDQSRTNVWNGMNKIEWIFIRCNLVFIREGMTVIDGSNFIRTIFSIQEMLRIVNRIFRVKIFTINECIRLPEVGSIHIVIFQEDRESNIQCIGYVNVCKSFIDFFIEIDCFTILIYHTRCGKESMCNMEGIIQCNFIIGFNVSAESIMTIIGIIIFQHKRHILHMVSRFIRIKHHDHFNTRKISIFLDRDDIIRFKR